MSAPDAREATAFAAREASRSAPQPPARYSARDPALEQAERGGGHLWPPAARAASSSWRRAACGAAPKCEQHESPTWDTPVRPGGLPKNKKDILMVISCKVPACPTRRSIRTSRAMAA